MRERPNLCNSVHLPAQSGSTEVLKRMRRGYTREAYLELLHRIREVSTERYTLLCVLPCSYMAPAPSDDPGRRHQHRHYYRLLW